MRRVLFSLACFAMLGIASFAIVSAAVNPVEVKPSALNGWVVDTTALGNPAVPFDFAGPADSGAGNGSFHFGPIGTPNGAKLEMQPPAISQLVSSFQGFQYQFQILSADSTVPGEDANHLYTNVYVDSADNGIGTYGNGFYDCRFGYVPASHVAGWNTFSFDENTSPTTKSTAYPPCATTNSLGAFPANSQIRFFRMSGGDTSANDIGLEAAYDLVSVNFGGNTTVYDFEPETACTTVCYVNATSGNDSFGGDTAASAKKTIQAAIDAVSANGQIRVLPGTYDETAAGRDIGHDAAAATYQFGLFFPSTKPGVTVMGVSEGDVAITDPDDVAAYVTTNASNNFGYSGVFVDADNTTIQGLEIGPNDPGNNDPYPNNKTIEVVANNFKLQYSKTDIPDGGGSVYINDWSAGGTDVLAYHVLENDFLDGTSVDVSNGAGSTGPVSGREIKNNHFDLLDYGFNGVSFNGTVPAIDWFDNPVGGAIITGNTFENSTQYIRSRGTVVDAEFDWDGWFNNNTFETAVMTGPDPENGSLTADAYDCGYGPGSCPNRKRIGATIQGEVSRAAANDIVLVKEGSYTENVVSTLSGLDFRGARYGDAVGGRTFGDATESTLEGQFKLDATNNSVDGFSIQHHINADDANFGVWVRPSGSGAAISNNYFKDIINAATSGGVASSQAVYLQNGPDNVSITDNKMDNISGYRSTKGIFIGDAASGGNPSNNVTIDGNVISNVTSGRGAYGILINNGGTTTTTTSNTGLVITENTISGLVSTGATGGGWVHGIGLEADTPSASITRNVISNITDQDNGTDDSAVYLGPNPSYASVNIDRNDLAVGNDRYGVANAVNTPLADAECNWWGDEDGPGSANGSDLGGSVDAVPWLLSSDLDGACTAISVNGAAADANGNEGSLISTNGSFTGSIASITADNAIGTFTPNAGAGTWTWSYTPNDNYAATTINVTANGSNGSTATDSFSTSAANVAPTATFNAPAQALYSTSFNISLSAPTDVSSADVTAGFTYAFDCGSGYGAASATNNANCGAPATPGNITVKGKIFDKDNGSTEYTDVVEITQPEITLTPASHNFGTVVTGSTTASTTFTVENTGTADLTISGVGLAGTNPGHFGIDTNNCDSEVLEPEETCTIDVFFNPTTNGAKTARLEVDSNDPDLPTADSDLTGSGGTASNGIITIVLDARPDGSQSFAFSGGLGAFNLVDNGTSANTTQFSKPAGQYVVQAAAVNGWSLKTLTCTTSETINKSQRKVTINLAAGENVTCTFTETQRLPDESIALSSGGPYSGVGIYASSAQPSQTQNRIIPIGQTRSFWVHVKNNGLDSDTFNVVSTLTGSTKFKVSFFRGATDITAKVNAGTYNLTLAAGAQTTIEIRVKTLNGTPAAAMRNIDLTMKSKSSTARDVVRAHVTRQ